MVTQCPGEATIWVEGKQTCPSCSYSIAKQANRQRSFDKQKAERRARQEEASKKDPRHKVEYHK